MDLEKYFGPSSILVTALICLYHWLFGVHDNLMQLFITFMVFDYFTGFIGAWFTKTCSSVMGFRGICKKACLLIIVSVAQLVDNQMGTGTVIHHGVLTILIANEGLSILENVGKVTYLPPILRDSLLQIRDNPDFLKNVLDVIKNKPDDKDPK